MAKVLLKKSSVSSNAPGTGDLDYGELAINYADGRLYYKNSSNQIKHFIDSDAIATLLAGGPATGITEIVQDTTPQLGGDLETNGNDIILSNNDKVTFSDVAITRDSAGVLKITDGSTGYGDLVVGNVGIGTNSPDQKLDIGEGNVAIDRGYTYGVHHLTTYYPLTGLGSSNQRIYGDLASNTGTRVTLENTRDISFGTNARDVIFRNAALNTETARVTADGAWQDFDNTFELRNSTNNQTLNLYKTYTDGSNYERAALVATADSEGIPVLRISMTGVGTGNNGLIQFDQKARFPYGVNASDVAIGFNNRPDVFTADWGFGSTQVGFVDFTTANAPRIKFGITGINMYQGRSLTFGSTLGSADVGVERNNEPGVLKITDGSTGYGDLVVGGITSNVNWNDAGTEFSAFTLNVTDSASDADSKLMNLFLDGDLELSVLKSGTFVKQLYAGTSLGGVRFSTSALGIQVRNSSHIGFSSQSVLGTSAPTVDVKLYRDDSGVLAQRNDTNAQTFNVYNTYTDASNYERGVLKWNSNVLEIGTEAAGTGTRREINLNYTTNIDGGNRTNVPILQLENVGAGEAGIRLSRTGAATMSFAGGLDRTQVTVVDVANRQMLYSQRGSGGGGSTVPAHQFTGDANTSLHYPAILGVKGRGPGADLFHAQRADDSLAYAVTYDGNIELSPIWDSAAETFTAILVDVNDSASAANSVLLDLKKDGSSIFRVDKDGSFGRQDNSYSAWTSAQNTIEMGGAGLKLKSYNTEIAGAYGPASKFHIGAYASNYTFLKSDAIGTLALEHGTTATGLNLYKTYTDASNYERLTFTSATNEYIIKPEAAGTGSGRNVLIQGGSNLGTQGNIQLSTGLVSVGYRALALGHTSKTILYSPSEGVLRLSNDVQNDFNRLQFGGVSSSYPAIKKNGTSLEVKLADDTAYTTLKAKTVEIENSAQTSETATLATVTESEIASFAAATYSSGKFVIQAKDSVTGEVHVTELLVVHDGTTASATEYGIIHTGASPLATYDVDINSGNVRILATSASTNSTIYKVTENLITA